MANSLLANLFWLLCTGSLAMFLAWRQKCTTQQLVGRLFGPSGFSLALYVMLTLPGVFLHEAAHAISALVLRVPIRDVNFIPRRSPDDLSLTAFVHVEKRDSLRMAVIALAPLLVGTVVLGLLTGTLDITAPGLPPWTRLTGWLRTMDAHGAGFWGTLYLVWSISSHMTPSRVDLRYLGGCLPLLGLLLLAGLILTLSGHTIPE